VTQGQPNMTDLVQFMMGSLYFCGTKIDSFRGPQLMKVINNYYMPFVRSGWTVPLAFVLDVCAMLLFGGVTYETRWKNANLPEEMVLLSKDYYKMLRKMRGNVIFQHVYRLATSVGEARRDATIKVFLRFLLAELSQFREILPLKERDLTILDMRPGAKAIEGIRGYTPTGPLGKTFSFLDPARVLSAPIIEILAPLMRAITDYYGEHPLEEFISNEELFMIDYTARSDSSLERLDYHFLHRVLRGQDTPEPEAWPLLSTLVEEQIPTDTYQEDGRVGGYVDVNLKRLSETVSEILSCEFALVRHREVMYHKMLNEGVLHYIREDIERIEPELRVLFYFVVDTSWQMLTPPRQSHQRYAAGITPWVLSKALVADMLRDLCRYFPRQNVRADAVIYLWSPKGEASLRECLDLLAWEPRDCASRFEFATRLAESVPAIFYHQLHQADQPEHGDLEADPWSNFERMCEARMYHCRHLALFTSPDTSGQFLPSSDLRVSGEARGRDSIWVVQPDLSQETVGITRPASLAGGVWDSQHAGQGMLTEERLRWQFLQTVIAKAAARRPFSSLEGMGET
jgi:hypothetical protein